MLFRIFRNKSSTLLSYMLIIKYRCLRFLERTLFIERENYISFVIPSFLSLSLSLSLSLWFATVIINRYPAGAI